MRINHRSLATFSYGIIAALLFSAGSVRAQQFTFGGPEIVSETRVERTIFEYTMRAKLTNNGATIKSLTGVVTSTSPKTVVVNGSVSFGDVPAGLTTASSDTFVIRHDRTVPFDPAALKWTLTAPPVTPVLAPLASPTAATSVTVTGTAGPGDTIEVVGGASTISAAANAAGAFSASVILKPNQLNRLFVTSTNVTGQRSASTPLDVIQDGQAPSLFIDFPSDNAVLTNESVVVAGRVGDMLSGFMGLRVSVNGQPAHVDVGIGQNGTFERGGMPLTLGANTIAVTATDTNGNAVSRQITVNRVAITGPRMAVVSGDLQTGRIHSRLANPIVVRVTNSDGTPFANKVVTFDVTRSDGRLAPDGQAGTPSGLMLQTNTDTAGLAVAWWTLGGDAGCGNNRVSVTSRDIAGTTFFCASATPAPARQINIGSGNNQRAEAGGPAPESLRAWVSDSCNGADGIPVTFTVVQGGGKVNGLDAVSVNTSTTGHAEVRFTFGPEQGNNLVEATFPGNPGSSATFVCYGVGRDLARPTTFTGLVLDNASQPIGHALCEIFVSGNPSPVLLTYTDPQGHFAFTDPPTGPVHLFVYGASATTLGSNPIPPNSFPFLTFPTTLIPNAENSLPTPVLLPRLNPNNARLYDGTTDLVLTCEGMAGLKMTIKANSMRKADGSLVTPQNKADVSLNQVHHDDVPMPIPDGASPPFAWTLQPGRSTFDPPIQIEYPNMSGLPAGAIAFFLSFNHDTERFEIVASGHVTADGSTIVSDPGAGLSIAGWGCNCPPYSVTGDCDNCPKELLPKPEDVDLKLAVDGNRDGVISFGLEDATSTTHEFQFWVNNDTDTDDVAEGGDVENGVPDSGDKTLTSKRDLEDFVRIRIKLSSELRDLLKCGYRLELDAGIQAVQVFKASSRTLKYLSDPVAAQAQLDAYIRGGQKRYRDAIDLTKLGEYFTTEDYFEAGSGDFLIEAIRPGNVSAIRVLLKRAGVVVHQSSPVYIRFFDVKQIYTHTEASHYTIGPNQAVSNFPNRPTTLANGGYSTFTAIDSRIDDSTNTIIFVHGWNMSEWDKKSFSETMFKRLWWAGFKGRFIAFRWPCLRQVTRSTIGDPDTEWFTFNRSEFLALEYSSSLRNLLSFLNAQRIHVIAHSQGNILASEALRNEGSEPRIEAPAATYVMMQAAVPASAYIPEAATVFKLTSAEFLSPTTDTSPSATQLDRGYRGWFASIDQGGVNVVNFYNTDDYALQTGALNWTDNQAFSKPSSYPGSPFKYLYSSFFDTDEKHTVIGPTGVLPLTDPHEVMAFASRSLTRAIGAYDVVGRPIAASFATGFGDRKYEHSGQFNFNIQHPAMWLFYQRLLINCGIPPIGPSSPGAGKAAPALEELLPPTVDEIVDETWGFSINGQSSYADAYGAIQIPNISAPDQFGAGGPGTAPDFIGDDYVRVIGVSTAGGVTRYAFSEFFRIEQGKTVTLQNLTFTDTPPRKPNMLMAVPDNPTLTAIAQTTQFRVTATYADKTTGDVTPATSWTAYRTSNVAVAKINNNGLVTAMGAGIAFLTAVNEGATSVAQVNVVPGDPLTTVKGFLRRADGSPAVGAVISISGLGLSATVAADGSFTFANVPTTLGPLTLSAVVVEGGSRLVAVVKNLIPVGGGVVDAGVLLLAPFASGPTTKTIAAGDEHTVALKTNGSLWAWGSNGFGQLGDGTTVLKFTPVRIGTNTDWAEISAGSYHTVGRKTDGSLWAWGYNQYGQLGDGTMVTKLSPVRIGAGNDWAEIAAGFYHTVARKTDGSLWAWGENRGKLGDGTTDTKLSPVRIGTGNDWAEIAAGADHTVALKTDGSLWAWGYNGYGNLGDGTTVTKLSPVRIGTGNDWAEIAAGDDQTVARKIDGSLWAWGDNRYGQLGDGTTVRKLSPVRIGTGTDWAEIAAGYFCTVARRIDGSLWAWGDNTYGELGDGTTVNKLSPVRVGTGTDWAEIAAGSYQHHVARKTDGSLWAWGDSSYGALGDGQFRPGRIGTGADWTEIAAGDVHTVARKSDGSLWAWGDNSYGELGDGTTVNHFSQVRIGTGNDWAEIAAGSGHTVARKTDGGLWVWGANSTNPARVGTDTDWAGIAAGGGNTVARKTDGSLWAWAASSNSPVRIGTDNNWAEIAAGGSHVMARKTDGSLWAWGSNTYGQLGDGTGVYRPSPVRIGADTNWAKIAAGSRHTLAGKTDGSLWAWGYNINGELGDGTFFARFSPVRIGTSIDWAEIAAGESHTVARKTDGSLWAWGNNFYGQQGDGTLALQVSGHVRSPVHIGTGTDWAEIAAGRYHNVARKSDGSLWAWGYNVYGQLGVDYIVGPIGGTYDWGSPTGAAGAPPPLLTPPALSLDTDGDGIPDEQELLAGTDPLDAASVFRITAIEQTAAGVEFTFNTVSGKTYRLEFSSDLSAGSWTTVSGPVSGTGRPLKVADAEPVRNGRRFYRMAVIATGEE